MKVPSPGAYVIDVSVRPSESSAPRASVGKLQASPGISAFHSAAVTDRSPILSATSDPEPGNAGQSPFGMTSVSTMCEASTYSLTSTRTA